MRGGKAAPVGGIFYAFANLNCLYFCIILFVMCVVAMIAVSLLTKPPSYEKIKGLTYATTVAEDKAASRASWNVRDVILSLIVLGFIAFTLIYFSGR